MENTPSSMEVDISILNEKFNENEKRPEKDYYLIQTSPNPCLMLSLAASSALRATHNSVYARESQMNASCELLIRGIWIICVVLFKIYDVIFPSHIAPASPVPYQRRIREL